MLDATSEPAPKIGARLRQARRSQRLSLRTVADRAGCSEGYISKIENDKAAPSLSMLHRLANVVGVNLSALFDSGPEETPVVLPHGTRPIVSLDPSRKGEGLRLEQIVARSDVIQCNIHIVEPGGTTAGQIQHEGEEVGYVLSGEIELQLDDRTYRMVPGDAFYFQSRRPHGYRNVGNTTAQILWVNTPPTF